MAIEPALTGTSRDSAEAALRTGAGEARMYAAQAATAQQRKNELQVEWHKKFAIPFACIVFVLLGAPLAIRFPRGGPGMVIALSLTIFGIYYISLIGGESLGDKGRVKPFWGPWAPNLIFLPFSLWALARIGRETATTRGGGWSDLGAALKGVFTPRRRKKAR